jgi:hypothetical protein
VDEWYPKLRESLFGGEEAAAPAETEGFRDACRVFLHRARTFHGGEADVEEGVEAVLGGLDAVSRVFRGLGAGITPAAEKAGPEKPRRKRAVKAEAADSEKERGWDFMTGQGPGIPAARELAFCWIILRGLGFGPEEKGKSRPETAARLVEDLALDREAAKFLGRSGAAEYSERLRLLLRVLITREDWFDTIRKFDDPPVRARVALESLFADQDAAACAGVNRYQDVLYFNREGFFSLVWWMTAAALTRKIPAKDGADRKRLRDCEEIALAGRWIAAVEPSGYRLEELFEVLDPDASLGKPDLDQ